jgi:uncharacterized lipoprotein YbaY
MADEVKEVPDQAEDPEGYVEHVQEQREAEAERAQAEADLQRERAGLPPEENPVVATHDISDPDAPKAKETKKEPSKSS